MIELFLNDININFLGSKYGFYEGRFYIFGGSDFFDGYVQSGGVGFFFYIILLLVNLKLGIYMYCVKFYYEFMQGYFFLKIFIKKMFFLGLVFSYFREYKI